MKTAAVMLLIAIGFSVARFLVPVEGLNPKDLYKDAAHLFVGFAWAWALFTPDKIDLSFARTSNGIGINWWIPAALTVVEVVAFAARG